MNAPAAIPEPAASVPSTAARPRLSASDARKPDAVIAPRAKNQRPSTDGAAIGCRNTRVATPSLAMSSSVCRRLSLIVLVIQTPPFVRSFKRYLSHYEVFKHASAGKDKAHEAGGCARSLASRPAVERRRPAGPGAGREVQAIGRAQAEDGRGGSRRPVDPRVSRGRVRPARLRK